MTRTARSARGWAILLVVASAFVHAQPNTAAPTQEAVFATVGDRTITIGEYRQALAVATRKKYYHAKPPEAELAAFQREVGDDLVNRVLLLDEAKRRGIRPDRQRIDAALAGYEARYKGNARWEANREKMLATVRQQLEEDSLLERLEKQVKTIREPTAREARDYYDRHKELFVEPEQVKLGVILLKVDPSSPQATWNAAHEEARRIRQRLAAGADFAELAKLHSGDLSAGRGGDMGYIHRGMLPAPVQAVVDGLAPGAISAPVQVLEGVAILRLDDRKVARQRSFDEVRERAGDLWQRAEAEAAWKALIADLRKRTSIRIDESQFRQASTAAAGGGSR
jgi:parvulin-like peptidyl-prolyl isomerase